MNLENNISRRDFLRTLCRYLLTLFSISLFGAWWFKRQDSPLCEVDIPCQQCSKNQTCNKTNKRPL